MWASAKLAWIMAAGETPHDAPNALPIGHRLHEFELRGVIGVGGFGIVYRAFDQTLEREVAIKEYMPRALAGRSGKHQVSLLSAVARGDLRARAAARSSTRPGCWRASTTRRW